MGPSKSEDKKIMENQHSCRLRFSFKYATIIVSLFNLVAALLLLQSFLSSRSAPTNQPTAVQLKYIQESEEMRRSMEPLELIKRVREIEQESYAEPEKVQQIETKVTAAAGLSKRLKDFHTTGDAASQKALEDWRKRKMERARQRELEKNGTISL